MGDLSDLKVAIWQREVREGAQKRCSEEMAGVLQRATLLGADCLITNPIGLNNARCLIPCDGAVAEYGDEAVLLHTESGDYLIGVGCVPSECDFSVWVDNACWTKDAKGRIAPGIGAPSISLAPVGIQNAGHSVRCFGGATSGYDAHGEMLWYLRDDFEEDFALLQIGRPGRLAQPCERKLLKALTTTIRRFDSQVLGGSLPWIIGLSGGLDSSIVASLLVLALGESRVVGYSLSSEFNSKATKGNAERLAESLSIRFHATTISDVVDAVERTTMTCGYGRDNIAGLVHENVQARMRGSLLCTFAAIEGGVVANNANFVELALGYCTLYGDAIGALAPIADLTKVELFGLARDINEAFGASIIPENLLPQETLEGYEWETMPSAELSEGQRDPMKWFYHDWLVRMLRDNPETGAADVLEDYRADGLESAGMLKWVSFYGLNDPHAFVSDLEWVLRQMHNAVFKRIQAPPAIVLSDTKVPWGDGEMQGRWVPDERYIEARGRLLGES